MDSNTSPTKRKKNQEEPFRVGDRVRHPVFGEGLVLEVSPQGGDHVIRVSFSSDSTQRKLLGRVARLERIESKK